MGGNTPAEAEPLLLDGFKGTKERETDMPAQSRARFSEAPERLVKLYEAKGNEAEAAAWRSKLDGARAEQAKPQGT